MSEFYQKIVMSTMCEGCKFANLRLSGCETKNGLKWYVDCTNRHLCEDIYIRSTTASIKGHGGERRNE